jgi:hypothetical protein
MFAIAGVAVEWRPVVPGAEQTDPVASSWNSRGIRRPTAIRPPALPRRWHIVVLYDRILTHTRDNPRYRPMILAHVMTHEITHVLQGINRHSAMGVMKARWDAEDFLNMTFSPLPFTTSDIDLLHTALRLQQTSEARRPVL